MKTYQLGERTKIRFPNYLEEAMLRYVHHFCKLRRYLAQLRSNDVVLYNLHKTDFQCNRWIFLTYEM